MSNPTTPFNWQMPTNTDLVTDLPADFEVFGQAVATSMADLLGGTTGQILAKATNADMDFTWIANDQGDITGVTATSPLTGGGTSGAITVGIQASSTTQSGAVQLSDSTSTTSSVLAATPTAVKSAYDLAAAAVPKSTVTTAGDVIYATGSGAVTRLGIGTAGQVLQVNSGATAPEWATSASGGMTLLSTTSLSGASTTVSSISTSYKDLVIYLKDFYGSASSGMGLRLNNNSTSGNYHYILAAAFAASSTNYFGGSDSMVPFAGSTLQGAANDNFAVFTIYDYANTTTRKNVFLTASTTNLNGDKTATMVSSHYSGAIAAITDVTFLPTSGTWSGGTIEIYGVK
jgi:hypothetical protein